MQQEENKGVETILVLEDSDFWPIVFKDLIEQEQVEVITPNTRWAAVPKGILLNLCRIHHSYRVNKRIELPLKGIWDKYDYMYKDHGKVRRWIFTDTSVRNYEARCLFDLKKQGIRLYMLFLNPICAAYETEYALKLVKENIFDDVYTVDTADSIKYGFAYTAALYSKIEMSESIAKWDVSFVGTAKDRLCTLHTLADLLKDRKSVFYIAGVANKDRKALCNVIYNQPMDYKKVLEIVNKSDCIIEVLQEGQRGFTFRTYEAICYNKKLITNNKEIKNSAMYNPDYIKIFDEPDKSILDFINNDKTPQYNYSGQYSPLHWYEDIIEREKNV